MNRQEKYENVLNKLKKLFNIKGKNKILEYRISDLREDNNKRKKFDEYLQYLDRLVKILCDLEYVLSELKKSNQLTSFKCYKVFAYLLEAEKKLQFFNDTIGDIKDYDRKKVEALVAKAEPFIIGKIETRIPVNPNAFYNEVYFALIGFYALKKNDALNLLSVIYGKDEKSKKAKVPKRTLEEYKQLKECLIEIIEVGRQEKKITEQEASNQREEVNKLLKNHL